MLPRVLRELSRLLTAEVIALDGSVGRLQDLQFDGRRVRYLVLRARDAAEPCPLFAPIACVAPAPAQVDRLHVNLTRRQIREFTSLAEPHRAAGDRSSLATELLCALARAAGKNVAVDILIDDEDWTVEYVAAGGLTLLT